MDISGRKVWQQAAGDTDRDYSRLCLKWDVVLNGPGNSGAWPDCGRLLASEGWSAKKITDLRRFAERVEEGDLVVLRVGTSRVVAVGEVVGGYEWHPEFGDVDGWDLQHVRRVRWLWSSIDDPKLFDKYTLKQGDTTQVLTSPAIIDWLSNLESADPERPLQTLPGHHDSQEIELEDISEFLFNSGVASSSIARLLADIGELVRIAKWSKQSGMPSEHETVAYLVIPLLRALGWTPQRMAVEWNRVDVALFNSLPRADRNLSVVVEAKKMNASCLSAMSQAQAYSIGKHSCNRLIVTDGLRYGVYQKDSNSSFKLRSYLNLTRLRRNYPIYGCAGAQEALLMMGPEWNS